MIWWSDCPSEVCFFFWWTPPFNPSPWVVPGESPQEERRQQLPLAQTGAWKSSVVCHIVNHIVNHVLQHILEYAGSHDSHRKQVILCWKQLKEPFLWFVFYYKWLLVRLAQIPPLDSLFCSVKHDLGNIHTWPLINKGSTLTNITSFSNHGIGETGQQPWNFEAPRHDALAARQE